MKKQNKGFTLIELLIVLAIIGILIALAIVGLSAAQASQRDTARKDLVSQINGSLQSFQSNTGAYPQSDAAFFGASGFINTNGTYASGTCTAGMQLAVNGACVGLDGLTINLSPSSNTGSSTDLQKCSAIVTAGTNNLNKAVVTSYTSHNTWFYLCYDWTTGSAGYQLGTVLEAGGGTVYYAAQ